MTKQELLKEYLIGQSIVIQNQIYSWEEELRHFNWVMDRDKSRSDKNKTKKLIDSCTETLSVLQFRLDWVNTQIESL